MNTWSPSRRGQAAAWGGQAAPPPRGCRGAGTTTGRAFLCGACSALCALPSLREIRQDLHRGGRRHHRCDDWAWRLHRWCFVVPYLLDFSPSWPITVLSSWSPHNHDTPYLFFFSFWRTRYQFHKEIYTSRSLVYSSKLKIVTRMHLLVLNNFGSASTPFQNFHPRNTRK
jgi:hypothetical protein